MADTEFRERQELMACFPSTGHAEDFDRMFAIDRLIDELRREKQALAFHAKERIDTMRHGSLVISKDDPTRIYEVEMYCHAVTYVVKTVIQPGCRSNNRSLDI